MNFIQLFVVILMLVINSQARANNFTESFIESVLSTHPSILSADAERQAAKEEITGSWRQILPELQVTTAKATDSGANAPVTQPKNTIALEQKLWAGGKLSASIDAAKATHEVAAYKYEETRISLALNVIEALQAFRASTDRIRVIDETLRRLNRFVQLMDRRVAAEVSPPIDAVLVRSRLVQAQVDKSNAVAARNLSISRLQQLNLGGSRHRHPRPHGATRSLPRHLGRARKNLRPANRPRRH